MAGYQVAAASDPVEALSVFKSEPDQFDLIITDMTMPNMRGDTFTVEVKRVRPDIPVILCTGDSSLISREKIKQLGLQAVAHKPVSVFELFQLLRTVLDGNSAESGPEQSI